MIKAAQLRQAILQSAVQGKLVPQNPHDEPASVLLEHIRAEKAKLIKEGKLKKEKLLSSITEDEVPFELPEGWTICRLNEIVAKVGSGSTPSGGRKGAYLKSGIKFLRSQNIYNHGLILQDVAYISEATHEKMRNTIVCPRDILLNITGASIGRCSLVPDNFDTGNVNQHVSIIRCIDNQVRFFLHIYLTSPIVQKLIMDKQVGMSREGLSGEKIKNFVVAIPPLAEQQRIVAKVEELMVMCDELEVAEKELDSLDEHFIEYLPKSILQAAVQGKLVPQDPSDEPASVLLERIRAEKARLIKAGKLKKEKPLPPITEEEIPYDLPDGWEWCRLIELIQVIGGVSFDKKDVSLTANNDYVRLFRGGNIVDDNININPDDYFVPSKIINESQYVRANDIIIVSSTGSKTVIGKAAKANKDSIGSTVGAFLRILRPYEVCYANYLFKVFRSPHWRDYISKEAGGTNINNIKESHLSQFLIPLPPLVEQQHIVAKVDELMALCGELKTVEKAIDVSEPKQATIIPLVKPQENEPLQMAARGTASKKSDKHQKAIDDMFNDD